MKKLFLLTIMFFMCASLCHAAGSVDTDNKIMNRTRVIVWEWTSDASGDVSGEGTVVIPGGHISFFASIPQSGVTDNFDVTVKATRTIDNGNSYEIADVLSGQGANLSNSTDGEPIALSTPCTVGPQTTLELVVANAGNAQSGTFVLTVWEERR